MKIVLVGGHLSPALAILEALSSGTKVLFIGRKYALEGDSALSLEYKTIVSLKIPFVALNTGRLQRKLTKYTIPSLVKLPFGVIKSFLTLIKFRPDVVVGFGGYVSIPVIFSAFLLRIPIIIHEQTMEAGFANRLISRLATKICISWDSSRKYFPKNKVVFTGNPIRKFSIFNFQFSIKNKNLPTIYVTGGSSGSHFINILIEGCARQLLGTYNLIHQTGDAKEFGDFERLNILKNGFPNEFKDRYVLQKFIEPKMVGSILTNADLIVGRSGANTLTEIVYFEKPSLLIPLPFSQNDEQLKNAKFLENIGLGKVLQQKELDSKKLFQEIVLMLQNIKNYKVDRNELKNLPVKNATQNIIAVINYVDRSKKAKNF